MKHRNRNKITEGPRMLLVLRRRFLLASMGALLAVLVLLCAAFNVTNYWKLERRLDAIRFWHLDGDASQGRAIGWARWHPHDPLDQKRPMRVHRIRPEIAGAPLQLVAFGGSA